MAFEDVIFPYYPMKHGISKTVIDPVSIVSNGSYEYRIKRQAWERYKWTLPVQTMTQQQKEDIKSFISQRNSSLNSFKFRDPDASAWNNAVLSPFLGVVSTWKMQTPLNYNDQTVMGEHPIFNRVDTELSITVNDVPNTNVVYNVTDAIPSINVLGANILSDEVKITGNMYFTVRLNSTIEYTLAALDMNNETLGVNHAAIELIEVFGEY